MLDRLYFVTHGFGSVKLTPHVLEAKAGRKRSSSLQKTLPFNMYIPLSGHFDQFDTDTILQYTSLSTAGLKNDSMKEIRRYIW